MRLPSLLVTLLLVGCDTAAVVVNEPTVGVETGNMDPELFPNLTIDPEEVEFAVTVPGQRTDAMITLINTGDADLTATLSVTGGANYFTVDDVAATVPPSSAFDVHLHFVADTSGTYFGNLTIQSNDPDAALVQVDLTGEVGLDADHDGWAAGPDCDDDDATVNPDATETWYDGVDQDCAGDSDYDADGDGHDSDLHGGDDCDDADATVNPDATEAWYDGNDGDCDNRSDYDKDGDGYDSSVFDGDDCNDINADMNPGTLEVQGDGLDNDCDGTTDEPLSAEDLDHDGYSELTGDCNDADPSMNPAATETWYDGLDTNCDGASDYDQDADGYDASEYGGEDCLDTDATINPAAADAWYDGLDANCDGASDYDQDGDGFDSADYGGDDCDDLDAAINPAAADTVYDGVDADCAGDSDYDADRDGHDSDLYGGDDCDDFEPTVNPGVAETWYDGIDQDCSGTSDYDQDGDGHDALPYGGDDCDDTDATAFPGASDVWYDGVDSDCAGDSDFDQDVDGHDASAYGGDDCLDTDATAFPGAADAWYDGVDSDCAGNSDYDADGDGYDASDYGGTDCDDGDATVHPGAAEVCDGLDNDCNGTADDGLTGSTWYRDADGDTYGDPSVTTAGCSAPAGYVADGTDCDDTVASTNPGAPELSYDHVDNDCNGYPDDMLAEDESSWTVLGTYASDGAGNALYETDDLDGDGDPELIVCADAGNTSSRTDPGIVAFHDVDNAGLDVDLVDGYLDIHGDGSDDYLGAAVVRLGDLDSDGADEVAFAAWQNDRDRTDDGRVYVMDIDGWTGSVDDSTYDEGNVYGESSSGYFGYSLATGDFDGDGVGELVAGAPGESSARGRTYVFFRGDRFYNRSIRAGDASFYTTGVSNSDHLGYSVAMGELTGDGYDDLVACAPDDDDNGASAGNCWLVAGSSTRDSAGTAGTTITSLDSAEILGSAASDTLGLTPNSLSIGDLDADGQDDLAIGAPGYDGGSANGGAVFVYAGGTLSGSETSATTSWLLQGDGALGTSVNLTSDLDGDGVIDLLAGATTAGASSQGRVYLFSGGQAKGTYDLPADQTASWLGAAASDLFGASLSATLDLDSDGRDEFSAGATGNDAAASGAGKAYVLPAYP